MTESRNPGKKKLGVMLINRRLEVPASYPDHNNLLQITLNPEIQELVAEGDYWRISGILNACITYKRDKPVTTDRAGLDGESGELAGFLEEKTFYDDGFSDHDEFAEESAQLLEADWEEGNPSEQSISYLHPLEFTGLTPRRAGILPGDNPTVSLVDMDVKTPGDHTVDLSVILLFKDEAMPEVLQQTWGEGVEFIQPFALTSWPPGMAEVVEWQVGYPEWQIVLKDQEAMVRGNLLIQVIGVEKEGQAREFTGISTQCPIQLSIALDQRKANTTITGVSVEILEVREDAAGLAVRGQMLVNRTDDVESPDLVMETDRANDPEIQDFDSDFETDTVVEADLSPTDLAIEADFDNEGEENDVTETDEEPTLTAVYSGDMDPDSHEILRHVDQMVDEIPEVEEVLGQPDNEAGESVSEAPQVPGEMKFRLSYSGSGKISNPALTKSGAITEKSNDQQVPPVPHLLQKSPSAKSKTRWTLYLVKKEDTLESICQNYGIDYEDFRAKNKLKGQLEAGQYLWVTK